MVATAAALAHVTARSATILPKPAVIGRDDRAATLVGLPVAPHAPAPRDSTTTEAQAMTDQFGPQRMAAWLVGALTGSGIAPDEILRGKLPGVPSEVTPWIHHWVSVLKDMTPAEYAEAREYFAKLWGYAT